MVNYQDSLVSNNSSNKSILQDLHTILAIGPSENEENGESNELLEVPASNSPVLSINEHKIRPPASTFSPSSASETTSSTTSTSSSNSTIWDELDDSDNENQFKDNVQFYFRTGANWSLLLLLFGAIDLSLAAHLFPNIKLLKYARWSQLLASIVFAFIWTIRIVTSIAMWVQDLRGIGAELIFSLRYTLAMVGVSGALSTTYFGKNAERLVALILGGSALISFEIVVLHMVRAAFKDHRRLPKTSSVRPLIGFVNRVRASVQLPPIVAERSHIKNPYVNDPLMFKLPIAIWSKIFNCRNHYEAVSRTPSAVFVDEIDPQETSESLANALTSIEKPKLQIETVLQYYETYADAELMLKMLLSDHHEKLCGDSVSRDDVRSTICSALKKAKDSEASKKHAIVAFSVIATAVQVATVMLLFITGSIVMEIPLMQSTLLSTLIPVLLSLNIFLKDALGDCVKSLVFIFMMHPFDIGDRLFIGTTMANEEDVLTVEEIRIASTIFRRWNGVKVIVPNGWLSGSSITNLTRNKESWERIEFDHCIAINSNDSVSKWKENSMVNDSKELQLHEDSVIRGNDVIPEAMHRLRSRIKHFILQNPADFHNPHDTDGAFELFAIIAGEFGHAENCGVINDSSILKHDRLIKDKGAQNNSFEVRGSSLGVTQKSAVIGYILKLKLVLRVRCREFNSTHRRWIRHAKLLSFLKSDLASH